MTVHKILGDSKRNGGLQDIERKENTSFKQYILSLIPAYDKNRGMGHFSNQIKSHVIYVAPMQNQSYLKTLCMSGRPYSLLRIITEIQQNHHELLLDVN